VLSAKIENMNLSWSQANLAKKLYNHNWSDEVVLINIEQLH
jgi:hypothetical protein